VVVNRAPAVDDTCKNPADAQISAANRVFFV
jgi:hypothetical protein